MLLARLTPQLADTVGQRLSRVPLDRKQTIFEASQPMRDVYFPLNSVCSLVSVLRDGKTAEIATVGREGMVGGSVMFGARTMPFRAVCQMAGEAYVLPAGAFSALLSEHGELRTYIERFARAYFIQVAQSSACSSLHDVLRRTARWLLMTHDRATGDEFEMTQDMLAEMLGVRRATVTEAASDLQRRGVIAYRRGHVHIVERDGLEGAACECYDIIRRAYREIDAEASVK